MRTLLIGGTRNLGPSIVRALLAQEHKVTVFHRGQTLAELPAEVEVLHGDRSDAAACTEAFRAREFDAVIDTTLYNGVDAQHAVRIFRGRIGQYVFLSTGQVYLVREGTSRPFREEDYEGPLIPEPAREDHFNHENWTYGAEKRAAEDVFLRAAQDGFPVTVLRLPMVNSERDHFHRIPGYLLRLWDGGPLLIPTDAGLPLRHVFGDDVVSSILLSLGNRKAIGRAYNISQDETLALREFLQLLAGACSAKLKLAEAPSHLLETAKLLPACSPFSDPWMSSLANERSKRELGIKYTPLETYLQRLVEHFRTNRPEAPGYGQRNRELEFARHHGF